MTVPSASYRRLALWTGLATFLLIVLGGIVRVSDSGLGCGPEGAGLNGWPFCNGDVVPGVDLNSIIEYSHRAVAGIVGILILALAVQALRRYRENRVLVVTTGAALILVAAQAILGGATVEEGLDETLVASHLGLAMLLLGLLIYIWRLTGESPAPAPESQSLRPLAITASIAVLCTIVAGGYMAGTQNYGRADYRPGDGAHHACGKEFPSCNGDFMPFGEARLVDIHLTHRAFMYIATALLIALMVLSLRRRVAVRSAQAIGALLVVQLLLGALNVWLDEYEALIVGHLAAGTLLWAATVGLALQLYRVPAPSRVAAGQPVPA